MYKKIVLLVCLIIIAGLCFYMKNYKITQPAQNKITIQFSSWGSESEIKILKPVLSEFENENPDINVEFLHIPQNYFQKLHLLFASNTAPDVVFINNQFLPIYANANVLEDLSQYKKELEFDKFYPKSLDAMTWNDKVYAIPRDISNLIIYYNKDIFDEYKVPYPDGNWDYDKFLQTAIKLSHPPKNYGISFEEDPLFYQPYLMSFGLDSIPKFEDEQTYKGLKRYSELRNKYHVAPKREEAGSATMAQLFLQGKLAMHLSGRWLVPKYREEANFDWDIVSFPKGTVGSVVPLDASGWAISKSSKHKSESLKLIKYLSSKSSSEEFTKSGLIVPARIETANSKYFLDKQKPKNAKIFLSVIRTSKPTPVTVNYREVLDTLRNKTEDMFNK